MTELILQGGGGHAAVVADCLKDQGIPVAGYCALQKSGLTLPYRGAHAREIEGSITCIVAIGDNKIRKQLAGELPSNFVNAVHPSVLLSSTAVMGKGCMLLHKVVVQTRTRLGDHVILNTGCQVDHDGRIGDFVHVGPGAVLCGNVQVGEGTLLGAGCVVLPNVSIGRWSVVGAGSVVTADVPDGVIVMGTPAKVNQRRK